MSSSTAVEKKDHRWKIVGGVITLSCILAVVGWVKRVKNENHDNTRAQIAVAESSAQTLTITTQMSELVIVEPDENIIQKAVTHGVEWEKYVNGVLVRYYPVGKAWVDMVPPDQIGVIETVAYRICDGQAAQTMQVAYCKYRTDEPPRNWFQAALRNKH